MFDIINILKEYGYIAMFLIALIENGIFFLLPGDSMLIAAGILAAGDIFNVYIVMMMFSVGSFVGNLIGYEIGKKLEIYRERHKWLRRILQDQYIEEAHKTFAKYGDRIVLVQRYIPMVRTFGPMVAGAVGMRYQTFILYSIAGSLLWSVSLVLPAYWLGNHVPGIESRIEIMVLTVIAITSIPVIWQLYSKRKKMRATF